MARTVRYVGNQIHILTLFTTKESINRLNNHLNQVDILPLVESSDVVGISYLSAMEDQIDCTSMILDIQPVADILTLSVNRQRLTMADIVDKQRNQLLRKLIRAIIIRAVGHDSRHAVSIVISPHEVVTRSLGG